MKTTEVTRRDIFLLSINRLDEANARRVRRACVLSEQARDWLFDTTDEAEQIFAEAIGEYYRDVKADDLDAADLRIRQAYAKEYSEGQTVPDDSYLEAPEDLQACQPDPSNAHELRLAPQPASDRPIH